jgi:DNA-directed RNA polymerase subunit RPC12/RpoP
MNLTVEQECPQCGAPIELDETDHVLRCPYCNVKNFLFAPDLFRFVLPYKATNKEIIYAPYLRFRGNVYSCQSQAIQHRVVDITHLGTTLKGLPVSLGVRPQAMKMKFVTPDLAGSFLKSSVRTSDMLTAVGKHTSLFISGKTFHRAYIGEALSLIYLPLFLEDNMVVDAVTNSPITKLPSDYDIFESAINENPNWGLTFMATLCPQCGWNLEGERDSVVLTCSNCDTAWEASKGKFTRVDISLIPGRGTNTVYMPFWKISATSKGVEINSYADFIQVTNQPLLVKKDWGKQDMNFWSPAFKIRPKIFLHLSKQLTILQPNFRAEKGSAKNNLYPVTLPQTEAAQGMKLTLAGSATIKKKIMHLLTRLKFNIKDSSLVYVPFTDTGHDMVQQQVPVSINKKALEFGRHL